MTDVRITDFLTAQPPRGMEMFEISQLDDTVSINGTTVSVLASDNSFNDTDSGFLVAGFQVGDRIASIGFAGANSVTVATVTAVTADKLTTDATTFADEAAGSQGIIRKWTTKRVPLSQIDSFVERYLSLTIGKPDDTVVTGDGQFYIRVPFALIGQNLTIVSANLVTEASLGDTVIQLARIRSGVAIDILTTPITIDQGTTDSDFSSSPNLVNSTYQTFQNGDLIRVDVDTVGLGCKGLMLSLGFDLYASA